LEAGWVRGPVWTVAENLTPTGIRSPDRPDLSESLYRLSYPGPHVYIFIKAKVTLEQATKAQMGSRGIVLLFL